MCAACTVAAWRPLGISEKDTHLDQCVFAIAVVLIRHQMNVAIAMEGRREGKRWWQMGSPSHCVRARALSVALMQHQHRSCAHLAGSTVWR